MGFDNECILNIQSLAGEYFCPVCRLLVYPNEALQSQCTHLYCKPCLTYIVSTTRACPYDGYLVREEDSKLLTESNKGLAETIGKITVHCLYHRSGCTWQGPLSDCTSHCSGCAFGNSPVVCNRCGIQIVHRQVQEHAQNCPGVQPQAQTDAAQDATTTGTTPVGDPTGNTATQAQSSQTTTSSLPGQDPNQLANQMAQPQALVQATVPSAEQWYQQQQQHYQQYYQQYLGYDPYQQHYQQYYPYQQQAAPQYQQPQIYLQPQQPQHPQPPQPPQPPHPPAQPQAQLQTQSQSHPHVQLPATAQPVNQPQVNLQQQTHMTSQPQTQTHPPSHGQQQSQSQLHPQTHPVQHLPQHIQIPQYPQPHSQIQHPQPQVQAQAHSQLHPQFPVPQPQAQAQAQPQAQPQPHSQGMPQTHAQNPIQPHPQPFTSQPNQPVNPPHLQSQPQHSSANAVTGHNSYPQPQPHQQMQLGGPQHPAHLYPQGGPQPQSHLVQMQNQFPPQPPLLRPPQSHCPVQNPQQPGLLPSPGQVPNVPPAQQQQLHSHVHNPGLPHQRPVMQSVQQQVHQQYVQQQPFSGQALGPVQNQVPQQGSYGQQQPHVQSQLRPLGPSPSFQQPYAYPQPQQNVSLPHGPQPHQAQNLGGRPMVSLHPTQPHPHSSVSVQVRPMHVDAGQSGNALRTNNQEQLFSEQQSGVTARPISERQGDHIIEKNSEAESTRKNVKRDLNDLDVASVVGADACEAKTVKSESNLKLMVDDSKSMGEVQDISESLEVNGEFFIKQVKKEPKEVIDDQKDVSNTDHRSVEHSVSEVKEMKGIPLLKTPPFQEDEHLEDHSIKKAQKDRNVILHHSGGFPLHRQLQGEGLVQPSHLAPNADQGKQQASLIPQGPSVQQQRPIGSPLLPAPPPGPLPHMQLLGHPSASSRPLDSAHVPLPRQPLNQLPEHLQQPPYNQSHSAEVSPPGIAGVGSTLAFGRAPGHYGLQGPYTQGHGLPLQGERTPLYGLDSDMFPKPNYTDGRRIDQHGQQAGAMRMNGAPGPDSLVLGLRDDRFKTLPDKHMNLFPQDPARIVDRTEFEKDAKHFPRPSPFDAESVKEYGNHLPPSWPLDRVPRSFGMDFPPKPVEKGLHAMNYDSGMKFKPVGGSAPSRFFPPYHPSDIGERPISFHDSTAGKQPDSAQTQQDLFGPVPRYGRRHMGGLAPRSPGRDYPGVSSHGFGAFPGFDDITGRESHRFGDPFPGNRFPILPGHLLRGEFEGPGQDGFPNHLRRGERLDPNNLPGHMRMGEPFGFGGFPGPARMGELPGPGNFFHPRLGEPGFRSSFSLKGIPGDGGNYTGDSESFDSSRRRMASSMGWCRICKVDCETVEGLDTHSQTREHQKMALDMVLTIKQNAKKQKLAPSDHSSLGDASKSRNASFEGHGNKN